MSSDSKILNIDSREWLALQFNMENLFIYMDLWKGQSLKSLSESEWQRATSSITPNKPLKKIWQIANVIDELSPDIVFLNEIGGEESLNNFVNHFLKTPYVPLLKEGNSPRGIDVGYLLKPGYDLKPVLISHKDRPINFLYPHENQTAAGGKSHYFSRDVAELRLFKDGQNSPSLVCLLTHLKSKLDSDMIDGEGRLRRAAELKTLVDIYNEIKNELGPEIPVILGGDLNGVADPRKHEPEFQYLYDHSDLQDAFDLAELPDPKRTSQVQIWPNGKRTELQIDYFFVSPALKKAIIPEKTGAYFFKSDLGLERPLPFSMEEKSELPSDHYPIKLALKLNF